MKPENAIEVHDITKKFKVYFDKGRTLKEKTLFRRRRAYEERNVLNGISFEVKKGEAVGLIGHNGCGKSTTLKLLAKIMYPDSGTIEMHGRVSSLIELGAGFHPDMSGRENIYINASIFGLDKKEIDRRLDEIIAFSELEKFIDNPVRTYSSGMYMRLAFSVAINVDADILLIDEILAVGDVGFQAKCFHKLREIKSKGTTIVIVSHSLSQIEQICEKSIWIHEGLIREEGLPRIVDPKYTMYMSSRNSVQSGNYDASKSGDKTNVEKSGSGRTDALENRESAEETEITGQMQGTQNENGKRWGSHEVIMDDVTILDADGKTQYDFQNDEPICIRIEYTAKSKTDGVVFGIAIYRSDETYIYGTNTLIDDSRLFTLEKHGFIELRIDRMPVNMGVYSIDLALHKPDGFNYDFWRDVCKVTITNPKNEVGIISLPHEWKVVV